MNEPLGRTWRWGAWKLAAFGVLGVGVVAMLLATQAISERHVVHYAPAQSAAADLRVAVASSHLWLEEHLAGDASVALERDVWGELRQADELLEALLDGGQLAPGRSIRHPLEEDALRRQAGTIEGLLDRFRVLAETRVAQVRELGPEAAGVGSDLDARYDLVFRRLLAEAAALESAIALRVDAGRRQSRRLLAGILGGWLVLLAAAAFALRQREGRRRLAEITLAERDAQLRQAQKLDAVGRLAGGLAHDLNNYLAAVNSQCGVVRLRRRGDAELVGMMDEVVATVGRCTGLVRRLLAFSHQQPVEAAAVDLNQVVDGLLPMMRRLLGDDVRLEVQPAEGLWPVEADAAQLEQVLVNLLLNARDALPRGGRVVVSTGNLAGATGRVLLAVADDGVGISPQDREHIFEPFFSTKTDGAHSGLGLSTVYGIVRQAGGELRVESEPGHGTRFEVVLPRTRRAVEPAARAERATAAKECLDVLLVEDRAELREPVRALLAEAGHRVRTAAGCVEALALLDRAEAPFDVVITDLLMPDGSGRDVALRALEVPTGGVLLTTGYLERVEVDDLLARERVAFLAKPFPPERLLDRVAELGRHRVSRVA
ncbi:MAG TPA: ATP-binding protein [Thermoanaerobaculia bacterium]|nr:ATP-binding protein [Thermoanaerobaculia bacterium]